MPTKPTKKRTAPKTEGVEPEKSRRGTATMAKLIAVTAKEIDRVGLAKVDVESLLKKSKISKGSLYHHFGSKNGLLAAAAAQQFVTYLQAEGAAFRKLIENCASKKEFLNLSKTYLTATEFDVYKKHYNKYLHRLNHGIDFADIKVSYTPFPHSITLLENDANQTIDITQNKSINDIVFLLSQPNDTDIRAIGLPNGLIISTENQTPKADAGTLYTIIPDTKIIVRVSGSIDEPVGEYPYTINIFKKEKSKKRETIKASYSGVITVTQSANSE